MGPAAATSPPRARARHPARGARALARLRSRRRLRVAATVAGVALAVLFLLAVLERLVYSGDVMPGVAVGGRDLGGRSERDAFTELSALAVELETEPLRVEVEGRAFSADPSLLGVAVDERSTLRAARTAARSRNPVEQTLGAILRRVRDDEVALRVSYSAEGLEGLLDGWQQQILDGNVEGDVRFDGTEVVEIMPRAGTGILRDDARRLLDRVLRSADRPVVELPVGRVEPRVDAEEVRRVADLARQLLRGDHRLLTFGAALTITPEQLVSAMSTRVEDDALELVVDPGALRAALGEALTALETAPVDARFEVTPANTVQVVPSQNGRQVDMAAVADAILDGEREMLAPLEEVEPERDTAWAESLRIVEQVSSFTTYHASGQARVTNIHRAADLIDDLVVEPGEVFSLNEAIGPRTPERGFVVAPVFYGEFTEDYGGGVSQLATTFFNAVFFGGYEDVYHKPHSIYITRYPMGREATVNYGTVDLTFRNDSSAGILIRTSYTDSSITVTFYGDAEGRVVREEDRRVLAERPVTDELIPCPAPPDVDVENACARLAFGQTETIEEGHPGYDVEFWRVIERPGREPERERFFWRYRMTPNRVLVGTVPPPTTAPPPAPTTTAPRPAKTTTTTP
jgi:vancomycin resistance protein YoaR